MKNLSSPSLFLFIFVISIQAQPITGQWTTGIPGKIHISAGKQYYGYLQQSGEFTFGRIEYPVDSTSSLIAQAGYPNSSHYGTVDFIKTYKYEGSGGILVLAGGRWFERSSRKVTYSNSVILLYSQYQFDTYNTAGMFSRPIANKIKQYVSGGLLQYNLDVNRRVWQWLSLYLGGTMGWGKYRWKGEDSEIYIVTFDFGPTIHIQTVDIAATFGIGYPMTANLSMGVELP